MHDIRLATSKRCHVGWAKYDDQFRLKRSGTWGKVDFEQWVMLIAQDKGQPPTTALDSLR